MALPALRQPKFVQAAVEAEKKQDISENNYIILTLKSSLKLVIVSDYYHGIITEGDMYKCVFCAMLIDLDSNYKELHKTSIKHKSMMSVVPYVDDFTESLVRKLNRDTGYCTICNVTLNSFSIARHMTTDIHNEEFQKALSRAVTYTPHS